MKRFFLQTLLFGLAQFLIYQCLEGFIFLLAHFPPRVVSLDGLIVGLNGIETVLIAPKIFFRWLWPGQSSPGWLNTLLVVANSLVWGAVWAGWRRRKQLQKSQN